MIELLEEVETDVVDDKPEIEFNFKREVSQNDVLKTARSKYDQSKVKTQVNVILLKDNKNSFENLQVCGKSVYDWQKRAVKAFHIKEVAKTSEDLLHIAKQNTNELYSLTLVFDNALPLVLEKTINQVLEYFIMKELSVLKFASCYLFDTKYLMSIEKLYSPQQYEVNCTEFLKCDSNENFVKINQIIKNKIISFHQNNGVLFYSPESCQVDADVKIENGTTIFANNHILGNSVIGKNCKLGINNLIENSAILENSNIESSIIKTSVVGKNCEVINFSVLENRTILKDNVKINNKHIDNKIISE